MERVPLKDLRRRLAAHGLQPPGLEANAALASLALATGRTLVCARLILHGEPGIGLPALLLSLDGPDGREVLAVAPGERAFALLEAHLGCDATVETELAQVPTEGPLFDLARALTGTPGARPPPAAPDLAAAEERLFTRIVCAANPADAPDLLRATLDLLIEETDAERGIVALARDGTLVPELARLRDGRDLPDPAGEVPRRVFEKVAAARAPVFVEDLLDPAVSLVPSASVLAKNVRSFLAAPLTEQGEVIGILYLDRRDRPSRFDARTRELFIRIAQRLERVLPHALVGRGSNEALDETGALGLLDLVGGSAPMRALYRDIRRLARQDVDVLVLGETGTGKELVVRALHRLGHRSAHPFEALNCAALPDTLLESTLFGHVRGAFTGADRDRPGLLAAADHGTLFLDEVGDMPASLQVKILRTLELGEVRPVGATRSIRVDVRLYFATHRDPRELVEAQALRNDLYYRLTAADTLRLPALRDRRDDIGPLARAFLVGLAGRDGVSARRFAPATIAPLERYPWPGNVRELRNVVLHSALRCPEPVIRPEHLVFAGLRPVPARLADSLPASATRVVPFRAHIHDYLARVHTLAEGNVSRMAELLDEPRSTVRDWLVKCAIVKTRTRRRS